MEYAEAVDLCLNYLHAHLPEWRPQRQSFRSDAPLEIYIACGGDGTRWDDFMGKPKQLIDLGEGIPLVQRTINQLSSAFPSININVITRKDDQRFSGIKGAFLIERADDIDRSATLEVLGLTQLGRDTKTDILWVYGDAFLSDAAVNSIRQRIQHARNTFCMFGRRHKNSYFGNSGGENFAVYAPKESKQVIAEHYRFLRKLYQGTPLHRYDTWTLMSLISLLKCGGDCDIPYPSLLNNKASDTYAAIAGMREKKNFHPMHWVDVNDESEDFDFPYEYIERVFRRVVWLGASLTA